MNRRRAKVLLVDDNAVIRKAATAVLQEQGFDVIVLEGSAGFVTTMVRQRPDLVLMDVELPTMTGDKLVEMVKGSGLAACPMVLFSNRRSEAELATLARQCGASGYIRKPDDVALIGEQIRKFLVTLS